MKFTFAQSEEGFDNHIDKSIRGYADLWGDVVNIGKYFIEDDTNVVDIGCSTGKLQKSMIELYEEHIPNAKYVGVEIEEDFYKDYPADELKYPNLKYFRDDVRNFKFTNCSYVTSLFTLQFMSPKSRKEVIENIYNGLNTGGAFVFSEKVFAQNPRVQDMMTFMYYDHKRKNFTEKEILDKEVQLRHMMKPNTKNELIKMCTDAGFETQTFWQNYNFIGVIALK